MSSLELQILHEVNVIREGHGGRRLEPDAVLATVARAYSQLMADEEFLSHHVPIAGMEDVAARVRAAGGQFDALGENIVMVPDLDATPQALVDSWLSSPGHRDNLLRREWEVSGVGVAASNAGCVLATQLFGIRSPISIDNVRLETIPDTWYVVRVDMQIGTGHSLGAFVRNRFVASVDADIEGRAVLECVVPSDPGHHHVGIGRRRAGSTDGWIGIYDGVVEISGDGRGLWKPSSPPNDQGLVHEVALFRVSGCVLIVIITGHARQSVIIVEDGRVTTDIGPGPFESRSGFRSGTGHHTVDIGIAEDSSRYRLVRRYHLDTARRQLREG